jgi:prefoldin beta subunit
LNGYEKVNLQESIKILSKSYPTGPPMALRALEDASRAIEEWRGKLQDLYDKQAQVVTQHVECELVLEEFEFLNETDVVLKQVGPTLIKQDLAEAKANVTDRVAFIKRQLAEIDASITETQKKVSEAEQTLQQISLPTK